MASLAGRRVVLTGASRGIGAALAEALAAEGADQLLVARDHEGLNQTALRVRAKGAQAQVCAADLTVPHDRARVVEAAGEVDVVVHNAGVEVPLAVVDQRDADVDRQLQVNLVAPIALTRALVPGMVARGRGSVVVISSMSGKSPTPYNAIYTATKFGINGFIATLRLELAGTGVHAGVVCPSFVAGAGMWADSGATAPALLGEVSIAAVVRGTLRAIGGAPEVLVTPVPLRPLLALNQLFPKLDGWVLRWIGVDRTLQERARKHLERRTKG